MTTTINVRTIDMLFLDDIFEMGDGYVLNFRDRTFSQFFAELNINIDDARYSVNGTSKAKRLRCFLNATDKASAVCTLHALWEYRETVRKRERRQEKIENAHRGGCAFLDRGINGFWTGHHHDRRNEFHEEAQT